LGKINKILKPYAEPGAPPPKLTDIRLLKGFYLNSVNELENLSDQEAREMKGSDGRSELNSLLRLRQSIKQKVDLSQLLPAKIKNGGASSASASSRVHQELSSQRQLSESSDESMFRDDNVEVGPTQARDGPSALDTVQKS
jgi:hypothetical protein